MMVRVLLFAALREKLGRSEMECAVEPGETVGSLAQRVVGASPRILFAVNDEFAACDRELEEGDTVALIPPMAGG